jgi:hypothetical protein
VHPHHRVPQRLEVALPPRISLRSVEVIPAIDLDDELDARSAEVDDLPADDDLPLDCDPELAAREQSPHGGLRVGRRHAHGASTEREL